MKHDYSIFTKAELAEFMQKYEDNYRYITKPYDILLNVRLEKIHDKITENLSRSRELTEQFRKTKSIEAMAAMKESHDEWDKLRREYDRAEKRRFPMEERDG